MGVTPAKTVTVLPDPEVQEVSEMIERRVLSPL